MPVSELVLRGCNLFASAPDALVSSASGDMEIIHLKRREVLEPGGRSFRGLGVVVQGRIQSIDQTLDGREVALQTVDPGEAFGQVALLASHPVHMVWVATAPSAVAVLSEDKALALFNSAPMAILAARGLADQVSEFLGWQKIMSVTPISSRVCAWICWSAGNKDRLEVPKQAELAWRLNTTRESITRTFQRLQADGLLQRDESAWAILKRPALELLALGENREGE
jgi:CRP/FNR family transcriptional regulator, cyclic AMP receptor protein